MSEQNTGAAPVENTAVEEVVESVDSGETLEATDVVEELSDAEEVVNDPDSTAAEVKAAKAKIKKLKLKVDGQEFEEELPFEIDDDPEKIKWITNHLQMSKVARKRMQEKAEYDAELSEFFKQLKTNPRSILQDPRIGVDIKKLAVEFMEEEIANSKKSPEQLRAEELERELKELRAEKERAEAERKQRETERLQQEAIERYDMLLDQAFAKNPDVPKNNHFIRRISEYMEIGLKAGLDVTPEDVIPMVKKEVREDVQKILSAYSEEDIESILGEKLTSIQKKRLARAKSKKAEALKTSTPAPTKNEAKQEPVKKISVKDFFGV